MPQFFRKVIHTRGFEELVHTHHITWWPSPPGRADYNGLLSTSPTKEAPQPWAGNQVPIGSASPCYTSKILTLIVSQVSSLQRSQVSHFVHKVASVACCSQVSQVSGKAYCHNAYVVPITTLERHLKHIKHLIWKKRNGSTELCTS